MTSGHDHIDDWCFIIKKISRTFRIIALVLSIRKYALVASLVALIMAIVIPVSTLFITKIWIYNISSISQAVSLLETLTSYILTGIFIALILYSRENRTLCRSGVCTGIAGTALSAVGCCSPIIYALFIIGVVGSTVIPLLTLVPLVSIAFLIIATCLLANEIRKSKEVSIGR